MPAPQPTTIGAAPGSARDAYADVLDMFEHLATLDPKSRAYLRHRDAIIERCLPLADHIARRFGGRGESHDDLVQVARVGLVNAVNRFDVTATDSFLAFAVPTMMGEVRRYFRDHGWSLHVPRRLKDLTVALTTARAELSQQLQRAPTPSELAQHLGVDRATVIDGLVAADAYSTRSTDDEHYLNGDGLTLADTLGKPDPNLQKVVDIETVRPLIAALPERDRRILHLRFFEHQTQTQIADHLGISQMHVSRLLAHALRSLRQQTQ